MILSLSLFNVLSSKSFTLLYFIFSCFSLTYVIIQSPLRDESTSFKYFFFYFVITLQYHIVLLLILLYKQFLPLQHIYDPFYGVTFYFQPNQKRLKNHNPLDKVVMQEPIILHVYD